MERGDSWMVLTVVRFERDGERCEGEKGQQGEAALDVILLMNLISPGTYCVS